MSNRLSRSARRCLVEALDSRRLLSANLSIESTSFQYIGADGSVDDPTMHATPRADVPPIVATKLEIIVDNPDGVTGTVPVRVDLVDRFGVDGTLADTDAQLVDLGDGRASVTVDIVHPTSGMRMGGHIYLADVDGATQYIGDVGILDPARTTVREDGSEVYTDDEGRQFIVTPDDAVSSPEVRSQPLKAAAQPKARKQQVFLSTDGTLSKDDIKVGTVKGDASKFNVPKKFTEGEYFTITAPSKKATSAAVVSDSAGRITRDSLGSAPDLGSLTASATVAKVSAFSELPLTGELPYGDDAIVIDGYEIPDGAITDPAAVTYDRAWIDEHWGLFTNDSFLSNSYNPDTRQPAVVEVNFVNKTLTYRDDFTPATGTARVDIEAQRIS